MWGVMVDLSDKLLPRKRYKLIKLWRNNLQEIDLEIKSSFRFRHSSQMFRDFGWLIYVFFKALKFSWDIKNKWSSCLFCQFYSLIILLIVVLWFIKFYSFAIFIIDCCFMIPDILFLNNWLLFYDSWNFIPSQYLLLTVVL